MASGRSRRSCSSSRAGSSIGSSVRLQRPSWRAYWTREPDTAHRRMRTISVSVQIRRSPGPAEAVGIRGYPSALEQVVTLRNGASVRLRPIRPDDQPRLMALTKTIAVHYAKDGIRCNCVAPAVTETPLTESRLKDSAVRKAMEAQYPLGRLGRPEDIAQAPLYLASH